MFCIAEHVYHARTNMPSRISCLENAIFFNELALHFNFSFFPLSAATLSSETNSLPSERRPLQSCSSHKASLGVCGKMQWIVNDDSFYKNYPTVQLVFYPFRRWRKKEEVISVSCLMLKLPLRVPLHSARWSAISSARAGHRLYQQVTKILSSCEAAM